MLTIACVLKSGGDFDEKYVWSLFDNVTNNLKDTEYQFVVLTDMVSYLFNERVKKAHGFIPAVCNDYGKIITIPLINYWPGWWAKIELFKLKGPVLYFDLDTYVCGDISLAAENLLIEAKNDVSPSFFMLESFASKRFNSPHKWASGVMAWTGDWSSIYDDFMPSDMDEYEWDQRYIVSALGNTIIQPVQDLIPDIVSYKHHCKNGIPEGTQVVCFHGKPRPHDVGAPYFEEVA